MGKAKVLILLVVIAGCAGLAVAYVHYSDEDKWIVYRSRSEHHPVINDLFAGKIEQGQTVEELFASWPPSGKVKHNKYTTIFYAKDAKDADVCCWSYSHSIRVIAINEKLVKALAVEGILSGVEHAFFNKMDKETEDDYWASRLQSGLSR
ncbi:MAG: hypothetical protein ABFR35_05805 [Thermodesulfobacteriota bacterium]